MLGADCHVHDGNFQPSQVPSSNLQAGAMRDDAERPARPAVLITSNTSYSPQQRFVRGDLHPSTMSPRPALLRTVGKREDSKCDLSHLPRRPYECQSVPDVKPWIERDIEEQQLVKMQAFIGMLLSRCCVESSYGDMDENIKLFDACRQTIVSARTKNLENKTPSPIIANLRD